MKNGLVERTQTEDTKRTQALRAFVKTVNATGGMGYDYERRPFLAADPEWLDLADAYILACQALGETPQADAQLDEDTCTCADRSWYGDTHDTQCPLSGGKRA